MELNILTNLLIISIILFVFIKYFILKREEYNKKIHVPVYILLLIYFFGFILNILWITKIIEYSYTDFYYIFSAFILIQSLAFFKIFYSFKKTKKWFFLFLLFIFIIISPFVYIKTTLFVISLSYLLMIFLFNFFIKNPDLKKASIFGLGYSSISLLLI